MASLIPHASRQWFGDRIWQACFRLPFAFFRTMEKTVALSHSSRGQQVVRVAIILALAAVCCYSQTGSRSQVALVVAPSASDVKYASRDGHSELTYTLQESYPAKRTLRFLEATLRSRKWKPVKSDPVTNASSHEREWTGHETASCLARWTIHQWVGEWQDEQHNLVRYTLRSVVKTTDTGEEDSPAPLQVSAVYVPASVGRSIMPADPH